MNKLSNNNYYCYIAGVFSRYSAPLHWVVHGHMTSDNETVSGQTPWAGNIAKTMTSNGKQCTVTREMLTAVAHDQSVQLKVAWCCRKNLTAFFKICFCFVLLYNKSLNDWSLGKQRILFLSNLKILRKQNSLFPSGPVIKCLISFDQNKFFVTWQSISWLLVLTPLDVL